MITWDRYKDIFIKYGVNRPTYDIAYYSNCLLGRKRTHALESIFMDYSSKNKILVRWGKNNVFDIIYILECELEIGATNVTFCQNNYTLKNFSNLIESILKLEQFNCTIEGDSDYIYDSSYWLRFKDEDETSLENIKLSEGSRDLFDE